MSSTERSRECLCIMGQTNHPDCPRHGQPKSDEQLAAAVRAYSRELNGAILDANRAGLRVEVVVYWRQEIGMRFPLPMVQTEVGRPL